MTNQEVIDEMLTRSCEALFAAYGAELTIERAYEPPGDVTFAGVIGFSGAQMRGNLMLAPNKQLLLASLPELAQQEASATRDWTGELANQLLGRLKTMLLACEVEIWMTTPIVIRGAYLSPVPKVESVPYHFKGPAGAVTVWFEAEVTPGVELSLVEPEGPTEGASFFF